MRTLAVILIIMGFVFNSFATPDEDKTSKDTLENQQLREILMSKTYEEVDFLVNLYNFDRKTMKKVTIPEVAE